LKNNYLIPEEDRHTVPLTRFVSIGEYCGDAAATDKDEDVYQPGWRQQTHAQPCHTGPGRHAR